jgi:hypothetical protein
MARHEDVNPTDFIIGNYYLQAEKLNIAQEVLGSHSRFLCIIYSER